MGDVHSAAGNLFESDPPASLRREGGDLNGDGAQGPTAASHGAGTALAAQAIFSLPAAWSRRATWPWVLVVVLCLLPLQNTPL